MNWPSSRINRRANSDPASATAPATDTVRRRKVTFQNRRRSRDSELSVGLMSVLELTVVRFMFAIIRKNNEETPAAHCVFV
jgi:hypothetical protein